MSEENRSLEEVRIRERNGKLACIFWASIFVITLGTVAYVTKILAELTFPQQ